jgi:hypothetical protein
LKGQWIGDFIGTTIGRIIVNIDELDTCFQGIAYLIQDDKNIPNTAAYFRTENKDNNFEFQTGRISPINLWPGTVDTWDNVKQFYPTVASISKSATVSGKWSKTQLTLKWTTDIGVAGSCKLARSQSSQKSKIKSKKISWSKFKEYISKLEGRRFLFRGQKEPWRLRTAFHRTGRADVLRFINDDIQTLHKHLSARTRHVFNLDIGNENGAFYNLVQHHGYPTPLLDWTYSPYVAAYFAYCSVSKEEASSATAKDKVRIFSFNQAEWKNDYLQSLHLPTAELHLSIGEFMAIENERMIPQQAASTVTNIDDIESYIHIHENIKHKTYLQAFDLPLKDRDKVIQELRFMGITAGSMFPGLDGACEELKDRNFDL